MNVGSLFAGIGGFDLGFERAGMRTLWQVEIDPFCRRVLECHFPDAERYEDVREVGGHNLAAVDLICGGFPCQAVSSNGHGLVQGDERWLWPEFARIIRALRPRYVVVENVAALLRRGFADVISDLAACGYDAEWDCIRASDAGAPHRRERLYLVAYAERLGRQEGPRVFTGEPHKDLPQPTAWGGIPDRDVDGSLRLVPPPDVQRVADGLPEELDRLRLAGNALVPQIAEWIGRRIMEAESKQGGARTKWPR